MILRGLLCLPDRFRKGKTLFQMSKAVDETCKGEEETRLVLFVTLRLDIGVLLTTG